MNKEKIIDFVNNNNLIGLKAGKERQNFLNIWMVVVDDRVFARSWGFAERSWYNTFLEDSEGELKCGDRIIPIIAKIPEDIDDLKEGINQAYLKKYNHGDNSKYALGIIEPAHVEKTMEFVLYH